MAPDQERLVELEALAHLASGPQARDLAEALSALIRSEDIPADLVSGMPVYGIEATTLLAQAQVQRKPTLAAPVLAVGLLAAVANAAVAWPLQPDGSGVAFVLPSPGTSDQTTRDAASTRPPHQTLATRSPHAAHSARPTHPISTARLIQELQALNHRAPVTLEPIIHRARRPWRSQAAQQRPPKRWRSQSAERRTRALVNGSRVRREMVVASGRYVVRPGDSLWSIAARVLGSGDRWRELWSWNKDKVHDPAEIIPGEVLELQGRMLANKIIPQALAGHHKVQGSFYAHLHGRLVWADTHEPVSSKTPPPAALQPARPTGAHSPMTKLAMARPAEPAPTKAQIAKVQPATVIAPVEKGPSSPMTGKASLLDRPKLARGAMSVPALLAAPRLPADMVSQTEPLAVATRSPGLKTVTSTAAGPGELTESLDGQTIGDISSPIDYGSVHALKAFRAPSPPSLFKPTAQEAAEMSLVLPGSGQIFERDWTPGIVDLALEGAAVAAIAAGSSAGSAQMVTFGATVLAANHVLSPIDAYARYAPGAD